MLLGANAAFNCDTAYDTPSNFTLMDLGDNETLIASPFNDAPNRDFSRVDIGNIKEGALPNNFGGGQ